MEISSCRYGNVLDAFDRISDRWRVHARSEIKLPQPGAAPRIKRGEVAIALSHEHKVAGRYQCATNQRLLGFVLPNDLPRIDVDCTEHSVF